MMQYFKDEKHSSDALAYAFDVINGVRIGCKEEIQTCQRFIDDFNRDFEYSYDVEKAEGICSFVELMPHTKGKWAAKQLKLKLENWQKFILCNLFGWVNKDGFRRFRKAYLKIPRKNGKSAFAAAIGHYMLTKDNEFGAEVYCGASTERQAWEVFRPARQMALKTPEYTDAFGIQVNAKTIIVEDTNSKFEALIGNPGDGASPSMVIVDEYHEHATDKFVETMVTGMGARDQPLLLEITTAGADTGSPCFDAEAECKKMLDGVFIDETQFTMIFGIDEGDDWTDPKILEKANPNFDISVSKEFLLAQQKEATRNSLKQNAFKRKHLNEWVGAHVAWLNMEKLKKCVDVNLDINNFTGKDCIIAIDLASKVDMTATVKLFVEVIDNKKHYTLFNDFYIPEETALNVDNNHYQKWIYDGHLNSIEGDEIDFNEIKKAVQVDLNSYNAKEITYDPWRATQLAQELQSQGATIVEFRNTVANMSPAMYELEAAIISGRFHYNGDPIFTWMCSNVVAKVDAKDNIYPRKTRVKNKIDGVVAAIMAIGRAMTTEIKQSSAYEERGIRVI